MITLQPSWIEQPLQQCYACEQIPVCRNFTAPELQCLNLYVPAAYLFPDGTVNPAGTVGRYTAQTAPVILENSVGGYMEAKPLSLGDVGLDYLRRGYVYVTVGARGRGTKDAQGRFIGKSPAALLDLKAAVRLLKANATRLPGDFDRMISVGTSAGGALSALLGVTGNSPDYAQALRDLGACDVSDDIFAAQCYCPIIDLEHADAAYEWLFQNDPEYTGFLSGGGRMSEFEQALSGLLAERYPAYLNGQGLRHPQTGDPLTLETDGRSGSAYEFLLGVLERAAEKYLSRLSRGELEVPYSQEEYLTGAYTAIQPTPRGPVEEPGVDKRPFLIWDGTHAQIKDLDAYVRHNCRRMKRCPAFDDLEKGQAENEELGDERTNAVHFDADAASLMKKLMQEFPEEAAHYASNYDGCENDAALRRRIALLNPMNYIGTEKKSTLAPHFRIRVGTRDAHTSFTVAMAMALQLMQTGKTDVDYEMVWDWGHGPADYSGEFCDWVDSLFERI